MALRLRCISEDDDVNYVDDVDDDDDGDDGEVLNSMYNLKISILETSNVDDQCQPVIRTRTKRCDRRLCAGASRALPFGGV